MHKAMVHYQIISDTDNLLYFAKALYSQKVYDYDKNDPEAVVRSMNYKL